MIGGGGGGAGKYVTYTGRGVIENDQRTYKFGPRSFGPAAPGRVIIVGVYDLAINEEIQVVEVQGVTATRQYGFGNVEFFTAIEPNTTQGQIVISMNNISVGMTIHTWAAYGLSSPTVHNAQSDIGSALEIDLNVPADGVVIAWAQDGGVLSGVEQDFEETIQNGFGEGTGGSRSNIAASAAYPISADRTGLGGNGRLVAASWG